MTVKEPAKNPCGSCPYRRDVPAGIWHPDEYAKLPEYDLPTGEQPPGIFICHQQNQRPCSGWVGCHDMEETLALRFAVLRNDLTPATVAAILDYTTPTPLFATGLEAAVHGLAGVADPDQRAQRMIDKLERRAAARRTRTDPDTATA